MSAKKKNSPVGTIIFTILLAAVIIGIYFAITRNKNNDTKEIPAETSEADTLIKKDLDWEYPATPREVLKLYCRITKCLYNDDLTDDQIKKLVAQVRNLYSYELLENNAEDEQVLVEGVISNLIYKGDHYSYVINTDFGQDFIVNDEYLWNMDDRVGLILPLDKMNFTVKK